MAIWVGGGGGLSRGVSVVGKWRYLLSWAEEEGRVTLSPVRGFPSIGRLGLPRCRAFALWAAFGRFCLVLRAGSRQASHRADG